MKKIKSPRHAQPTAASLREMPEIDSKVRGRRNPYAAVVAKEGFTIHVERGRPRKADENGTTSPRSVRFPDAIWKKLEMRARQEGISVHAAMREAILAWLKNAT